MKQQMEQIMADRGGPKKMLTALLDKAEAGELRAVNMVLVLLGEDTPGPQAVELTPEQREWGQ